MKKSPFRIIATLLLVIATLSLSGVTATAASLVDIHSLSSCCDSDCEDETTKKPGPCSTPDCPCFSCISMVPAAPFVLRYFYTVETIAFIPTRNFQLSEYIASIDYPPEAA